MGQSSQELAATLRNLRKQAGLSGDRLATRCNMSQSKVSRIENGKVRPSLVDMERITLHVPQGPGQKQLELAGLEAASTDFPSPS
ncbi:helix-turn-helix transcriptional regulator [Streptomyces sp. NPDC005538]|uniref:helix-turn-helix domain-containing protein n=1 Tax=unclassified Streptomyces TaxID=2593676 RepID=UPI00339FD9D0